MSDAHLIHQAKIELLERCSRINDIPRELPEILKAKYDEQWKKFIYMVEDIKCKFINKNEPFNSSDSDYIQALKRFSENILSELKT